MKLENRLNYILNWFLCFIIRVNNNNLFLFFWGVGGKRLESWDMGRLEGEEEII